MISRASTATSSTSHGRWRATQRSRPTGSSTGNIWSVSPLTLTLALCLLFPLGCQYIIFTNKLEVIFWQENTPVYDTRSRWHNIVLPDINLTPVSQPLALSERANRQTASYVFFALEPNTKYEVRLQAKNLHGWSQFSEDFVFTTRSRGDVPKELPVETLHNSNDISGLSIP